MTSEKNASPSVNWIAVAAMGANRVIGRDNRLPWHLPEDMKWFRELTRGGTVLMGRKTLESMGGALPKRRNLVLSRKGSHREGVEIVPSVEAALELTRNIDPVFVIGGAVVFERTRDLWSEVFLTRLNDSHEGDTFFPEFESAFPPPEIVRRTEDFVIEHYVRR